VTAVAEPVLLATKLHAPVRRGLVNRPRLVDRLRPTEHGLTLIDAPAGWGKTSLLADWYGHGEGGAAVAWLALDAGDDDPVLFWSSIVAALRTSVPGVGGRTLAALGAGGRALREAALPALVNDLLPLPGPLVLVLDDYHAITDPEIHAGMALLLEHRPPHLHFVLAARTPPPLPLGRLRVAGELAELRTDELALTDAEVGQLLAAAVGPTLGPDDVRRLARRTEGWPAGVSLAAASLAGRPDAAAFIDRFTGTDRYVLDYLGTEVLARLPADLCEFLLHTSVLRRLSPSLCEAVTGRADAGQLLDELERRGLFLVALDDSRRWFRYHRLFGELLAHELSHTEPTVVPQLHRRAAAWYAAHDGVSDAVRHHVAAGDIEDAAELVAQHWNAWFNAGRLATVGGWLDQLPRSVVRGDPRLCTARAWLLLDYGRLDEVDAWVAAGDAATGAGDAPALRDLAVLRAVHRFKIGDLRAARAAAGRVLELDGAAGGFAATVAHLITGITAFFAGDAAPQRPLAEAVRLARRTGNVLAETYGLGYLALVAADGGALDDAARMLPVALEKAADPAVAEHFVAALPHLARATLLGASGRPERAAEAAGRALALAQRGAGRLELALALAARAAAAAAAGDDEAPWLDQARALVRGCPDPGGLVTRWTRARVPARTAPPRPRTEPGEIVLSDRERELLPLLAGTLSQREIGGVLHLSLNTVKTHSRLLFRKLGVSSRAEAVRRARELGLL
jgi:LuxR family maltose regulon positive regulatory protein